MFKSRIIAGSLAAFLLFIGGMAIAAEASEAPNIGFVLYTKSRAPGTLNARWTFANK